MKIYALIGGKWVQQFYSWIVAHILNKDKPLRAFTDDKDELVSEFKLERGKLSEEREVRKETRPKT